jgi:hypothetical protein
MNSISRKNFTKTDVTAIKVQKICIHAWNFSQNAPPQPPYESTE